MLFASISLLIFFTKIPKNPSVFTFFHFVQYYQRFFLLLGFAHHCSTCYVILSVGKQNNIKEVTTAVNKTKKIISLLSGLGEDISARNVTEVKLPKGRSCIELTVEHVSHTLSCPECDSESVKKHGKKNAWAMHIPQGKRKTCKIHYKKQRYMCKSCNRTFFEKVDWIHENSHLTVSLWDSVYEDLTHYITKKDIARINGISEHYVDRVAKESSPAVPDHLPEVICLDETHSEVEEEKGASKVKWVKYVTNVSNGSTGELCDILPFRNMKQLARYFKSHYSYKERCKVKHLCCDMAKHYMNLVKKCFPKATVCVDNYHVTNRLNKCVNNIRIKEQNRLLDAGKKKDYGDLKGLSHRLTTSLYHQRSFWEDKVADITTRMNSHFKACPELKDAYAMLQYFHEIFHSSSPFKDKKEQLALWISVFKKSTSDTISKTVETVENHLEYIHNAWQYGYSNATCEGNNRGIQTIKNLSFGIRDFEYFRTRTLLIIGKPGVARAYNKITAILETSDCPFFSDFPSLEEYVLAFDWSNPHVDQSLEGA